MASRFYSDLAERKVADPARASRSQPKGGKQGWSGKEKTAAWKPAGKAWGSSFNRATRVPVVKTRAAKQGID